MQSELEIVARETPCIPLRFVSVQIGYEIFKKTQMMYNNALKSAMKQKKYLKVTCTSY